MNQLPAAEDLLERLDDEQRAAAESLIGPTCILAGAGSGKTRTITHRIAYGIARGYYTASRVLALTYTNRAAGELRQRLRDLGAAGVQVKTFHAAALSQLEYFWPQYAGVPAPMVLDSKLRVIGDAAKRLGFRLDQVGLKEVASEIEWRKFSMFSIEQYRERISGRPVVGGLTADQHIALQEAYEEDKIRLQRLDWEDVLLLIIGLLRAEPAALDHVHQQYRFFTVDEYQDISPLQHALLDVWLGDRNDLCVVGDPNQTIYSFTGATSEYLRNFESRYDDAKILQLTTNYRCTKSIVEVANRVVREDSMIDPLVAIGEQGSPVGLQHFETNLEEADSIAEAIAADLRSGIKPHEIAVLYRVNGQSEALEAALADRQVGYQLRGGERFFNRPEIQRAMTAIRAEAATGGHPDKHLFEIVSDVCRSVGWSPRQPDHAGPERDRNDSLSALLAIVDEMPEGSTISQFAAELEERKRSQHEPLTASVTLSTIHAAKGLEWSVVYLLGTVEGYLPIGYAISESALAEERRLFYVAVTRAKQRLSISYAKRESANSRERRPSRFLSFV